MNAKGKRAFTIVGVAFAIFIVTASLYFNFAIQEWVAFRNDFGYNIQTVRVATTFENMKASLVDIKTTISSTMPGNPNNMYSTIIPWYKTPDNSLQMYIRQIDLCIERLDLSTAYYKNYKQNTSAALINDWYSSTINNIKSGWANTSTFTYVENTYIIQKYGVLGDISIHIMPLFAVASFFIGLATTLCEISEEDLDSTYEFTYTTDAKTPNTYTTDAWTKRKATKNFNKENPDGKIIQIKETEKRHSVW